MGGACVCVGVWGCVALPLRAGVRVGAVKPPASATTPETTPATTVVTTVPETTPATTVVTTAPATTAAAG